VLVRPLDESLPVKRADITAPHQWNVSLADPALNFPLGKIQSGGDLFDIKFHEGVDLYDLKIKQSN
jgi:hypothetical protein